MQADDGVHQVSNSDTSVITRVNDNAPVISVTAVPVTEESVSVGDVIATFTSSDPDGDTLTHTLLNDPNGYFEIDGTDIKLTQAGVDAINDDALDLTSLTITVQADDGVHQVSNSDTSTITRVNDNAPVISVIANPVTEESVNVGDVIATFTSNDPDGDTLTHTLLNDPNNYFEIDGTDIKLTQAGVDAINDDTLDLDSLTITVQADDSVHQVSNSDTSTITRVNDNAPVISVIANPVTEESVNVGDVIATFTSSDPDGNTLTHTLLNDPNGYFEIDGTDIKLTQAGVDAINDDALDLSSLTITVQADDGTYTTSASDDSVIIRVNDNAPVISVTANPVTEESVSVGDVIATFTSSDPDGDTLTHTLLNDPNGYFEIDGTDIKLTQAGVDAINDDTLDLTSLTITVQADDGTYQTSASDNSVITRVNDNAPAIADASVSLDENVAAGTAVTNVNDSFTGTDLDRDGDAITYSI
ncbi:hypothetical protein HRF68_19690, partial [Pseudomonas stutzeri]|nr:hypothetical protein [Stutzerimonas stutzeri]